MLNVTKEDFRETRVAKLYSRPCDFLAQLGGVQLLYWRLDYGWEEQLSQTVIRVLYLISTSPELIVSPSESQHSVTVSIVLFKWTV